MGNDVILSEYWYMHASNFHLLKNYHAQYELALNFLLEECSIIKGILAVWHCEGKEFSFKWIYYYTSNMKLICEETWEIVNYEATEFWKNGRIIDQTQFLY